MLDPERVRSNLARVRDEVDEAAARAGRAPGSVSILAAVKYLEAADLPALREGGVTLVGENRVEQLLAKQRPDDGFEWDFIGQLQSRKARELVGRTRLIHSISSLSACERLERFAGGPIDCLLEVNVSGEESKAGVAPSQVDAFLEAVEPLAKIRFSGLMTMPPFTATAEASRAAFARLRELEAALEGRVSARHRFIELSMGTSQDYVIAAAEGATIVRVGTTLFRD